MSVDNGFLLQEDLFRLDSVTPRCAGYPWFAGKQHAFQAGQSLLAWSTEPVSSSEGKARCSIPGSPFFFHISRNWFLCIKSWEIPHKMARVPLESQLWNVRKSVAVLGKEKPVSGIDRFYIMEKEQKEERTEKGGWERGERGREGERQNTTQEVSTFTNAKAVFSTCPSLVVLEREVLCPSIGWKVGKAVRWDQGTG